MCVCILFFFKFLWNWVLVCSFVLHFLNYCGLEISCVVLLKISLNEPDQTWCGLLLSLWVFVSMSLFMKVVMFYGIDILASLCRIWWTFWELLCWPFICLVFFGISGYCRQEDTVLPMAGSLKWWNKLHLTSWTYYFCDLLLNGWMVIRETTVFLFLFILTTLSMTGSF